MESEDSKERERKEREYVARYGQQLIRDVNEMIGPKLLNYKEQFISRVNHVFDKWESGQYNNDILVMYAIEKRFYKKLSFEEGYDVWSSSEEGKLSIDDWSEQFPSRIVEKLGRQRFAQKIEAKQEYDQYTQELAPYMEELKKAQAKKEAAEWKKMEKEAGVSSRVPADIKEHKVIMNYLLKRET